MTTKNEMIEIIRAENPNGLRVGDDERGYVQLSDADYETQIEIWAEGRLEREAREAEAVAKASARQVILDRLGLTAEEATILLG